MSTTPAPPVYCQICGRQLRTPESKRRGRGPTCDEKVNPTPGRDHSPHNRRRPGTATAVASAGQPGPDLLDELDGAL